MRRSDLGDGVREADARQCRGEEAVRRVIARC